MTTPATTAVTFVQGVDEVWVEHNGETVWTENSWGYIDQYLQFHRPNGAVEISYRTEDED